MIWVLIVLCIALTVLRQYLPFAQSLPPSGRRKLLLSDLAWSTALILILTGWAAYNGVFG